MLFSINRKFLTNNLEKLTRIINTKIHIPSLLGIIIEVNTSYISLTTSNNNVSTKLTINQKEYDLDIKEVGTVLIKGKLLLDIIKKMDDEIITFSKVDKNILNIIGENNQFNLNIMDYNEFPIIGFKRKGIEIKINGGELKNAINKTIISINEYHQKTIFTGLNFKIYDNVFNITTTDSCRISKKVIEIDKDFNVPIEANLPFRSAIELIKLLNDDEECTIIFTDDHLTFKIGKIILQSIVLEGKYPNINKIIPNNSNTTIYVKTKDFLNIIMRADIPNENNNATNVNIVIDEKEMYFKSQTEEIGNFEEKFLDFDLRGYDQQNISFNVKFLLDAIKTFNTEIIEINFMDSKKPILISSPEDKSLTHVILPVANE